MGQRTFLEKSLNRMEIELFQSLKKMGGRRQHLTKALKRVVEK